MNEVIKRAKKYLAFNAAESGADVLIADLIEAAMWQPLDTAPRDGSKFLAFTADFEHGRRFNERVQEARWTGKTPDDRVGHFGSSNGQIVTHWMPLPAAPRT